MVAFHTLFKTIGVDPASGWAWGGSIVGLVVVIRILLIPLFVKQINAQRGLQILQPEIKKIQAKYKGKTDPESRQKQQQEMMKLYKDNGTNPLASCLPILLQAPIFFALFHVLNGIGQGPAAGQGLPVRRGWPTQAARRARSSARSISDKFLGADSAHRPDRQRRADRPDVGDDVPDAEAADEQEHAGRRDGQPVRPAAEDPALRLPADLRRLAA